MGTFCLCHLRNIFRHLYASLNFSRLSLAAPRKGVSVYVGEGGGGERELELFLLGICC